MRPLSLRPNITRVCVTGLAWRARGPHAAADARGAAAAGGGGRGGCAAASSAGTAAPAAPRAAPGASQGGEQAHARGATGRGQGATGLCPHSDTQYFNVTERTFYRLPSAIQQQPCTDCY